MSEKSIFDVLKQLSPMSPTDGGALEYASPHATIVGLPPPDRVAQTASAKLFFKGARALFADGFHPASLYARGVHDREQQDVACLWMKDFGGGRFGALTTHIDYPTGICIALAETSYGREGMHASGEMCRRLWKMGFKSGVR